MSTGHDHILASSPYLRGDGAAAAYVGMVDPRGRTFRKWAEQVCLPFTLVGAVRTYRKTDIDRVWEREAANLVGFTLRETPGWAPN